MKIPKYIEQALKHRASAARSFWTNDRIISNFIRKHGIDVDSSDYGGGVDSLFNPEESNESLREAIKNHSIVK